MMAVSPTLIKKLLFGIYYEASNKIDIKLSFPNYMTCCNFCLNRNESK